MILEVAGFAQIRLRMQTSAQRQSVRIVSDPEVSEDNFVTRQPDTSHFEFESLKNWLAILLFICRFGTHVQ